MKTKYSIFLILLLSIVYGLRAQSTNKTLDNAAHAIATAKGISTNFQLKSGGKVLNGIYKAKGNKFSMVSNGMSIWFDGKNMWTNNPVSKETTLTIPNGQEILESNPLSYIKNYKVNYIAATESNKKTGLSTVKLTPKKTSRGLPSVIITLNSVTSKPTELKIISKGLPTTIISLTNVNYTANILDKEFVYPASRYKNTELVDMR